MLLLTSAIVGLRVILSLVFHIVDGERPAFLAARLATLTACDVAMCVLAVATIVAFVQYGRIYNARVPTE
ncbi:MAG: hypothetical protein F4W95_10965 [Chloroflexi bacterium]|nr:hypothetical protein [Chloroflexota bacterium]